MNAESPITARPARTVGRMTLAVVAAALAVVFAPGVASAQTAYTVQQGDTLAGIAATQGVAGGYQAIADANASITDPNLIIAGATITLPSGDGAAAQPAPEAAPAPAAEPAPEAAPAPAPEPEPAPEPAPEPEPAVASGSVWDSLAQCESGGNWAINTGNGYYGGLQFSESSWNAVGGTGLPHEHSRGTQIAMGERLQAIQGWGAWPACSAKLGLS